MRFVVSLAFTLVLFGCTPAEARKEPIVLYTSQDQIYAEPILKEFTAKTGIEVRSLFDSESAKTAGLAHRLRYESDHPVADVFWSNEELHARLLARDRILDSNKFKTFGYRTRRLVLNTNEFAKLQQADKKHILTLPSSLLDLTNAAWNGRVAIAYPLFGTTGIHFLALRHHWGEETWKRWCHELLRNGTKIVDGNSVVVKLVGAGEAVIGLTDYDDIVAGQKQGMPIQALPLWPESFAIRNTIAIVNGAPHSDDAQTLLDYLSSAETANRLVQLGALEGVEPTSIHGSTIQIDWMQSMAEFQDAAAFLRFIFTRK